MMDAVRDFAGAALVVAHDEHLLNEVATKLIVFKNDRVFSYPGTYREFLESVGGDEDDDTMPASKPKVAATVIPLPAPSSQSKIVKDEGGVKKQSSKMSRKARAEFNAKKKQIL